MPIYVPVLFDFYLLMKIADKKKKLKFSTMRTWISITVSGLEVLISW